MANETVGGVRPTQLLTTYGVGSTVDLPQMSVMVMGLDDWPVHMMEQIHEDRLLQVVRYVLQTDVKQLKAAPVADRDGLSVHKFGVTPTDGVPVAAFPRWLVCTHCRLLAPISSALFDFKREFYRPEMSRFVHTNCVRSGTTRPEAIPARFLVACESGHIDDFPWSEYLHENGPDCSGQLELRDVGVTGEAVDIFLVCRACQKRKPMGLAFTENGRAKLPTCRGWHPHLRFAPSEPCGNAVRPMLLGATNQWFSSAYSALSIPSSADPLEQMVEQDLTTLFDGVESAREAGLSRRGQARYDTASDEQIWQAVQKLRATHSKEPVSPQKLKIPEWRLFSQPDPNKNGRDLYLRVVPPPTAFQNYIEQVVLVERLREVRALVGFSRIESAGEDSLTKLAPLRRGNVEWVPAAEIRGEGIFLRFAEKAVVAWKARCAARNAQFVQAHRRWRQQRKLDPDTGYPGLRYVLLHSLSHALIRQFSLDCGYAAAGLQERIYSADAHTGEPMAGILIYTAAPDSEGTLGGLVSLGETQTLERHLEQALECLEICASDPLCAETQPDQAFLSLHGAACHNCLLLPETSCERGNRYLDRSVLVATLEHSDFAFFGPLGNSPGGPF